MLSIFAVLLLAAGFIATAQSNAVDGAVNGYVTDASGAAIPDATVTLLNQDTNVTATLHTGKDGYFRYPLVPLGTYTLSAAAAGFDEYRREGITVKVGSDVSVSPSLTVRGDKNVTVEVRADASMIESATPAIGGVVTEREMEDLPITSRNVYNLFFFVPGAKGIPSDNFATPGYSFGGVLRASWNLDGIDNADRASTSPLRLVIVTPGAVRQIQVLANGYQAEFGKSSGGQTSVITRGGDNHWHGSAMYEYRPQPLAAIPALATKKPDLQWFMAEGNLGGPIIHDHLFFFANYEHNPYVSPNANTITATTIAALGLTPDQVAIQNTGQNYDSPSIRVDYHLNAANSGFLRYVHFQNNSPYSGSGGLSVNSRSTHSYDQQDGGEVQLATVKGNLLNEVRFGINRREIKGGAQFTPSATDVYTNISGYANLGNSPSQSNTVEQLNQVVDNVTWQRGRHTIKAGGDYQWTQYRSQVAPARTFTFSGLTAAGSRGAVSALNQYLYAVAGDIDSATGAPYTYTSLSLALGDPTTIRTMQFFNGFVQDQYRFRRNLVVTGGLRYEKQLYPEGSPDSTFETAHRQLHSRNLSFAPRANVAWQATPKTMVSAAGGLYFDVPNLSFFTNLAATDSNSYHTYTVAGGADGAPTYPNIPTSLSSAFLPKPNLYIFDPSFRSMYAVHANARVQQVLSQNFMLTISYIFVGTRFGPYIYDTNLTPTGVHLADGRPVYSTNPRPNQNYGQIYQYTSHGTSNYNGVDFTLEKRLSRDFQFTVNYSWSHALGDSDQNGYVVSDPSNVHSDYGNMSTDVRHYFIGRGLYSTRFRSKALRWASGTGFSVMSLITSGYPLDARTTDLNGDLASNDRPIGFSRNAFRGPSFMRFDARASKSFRIRERYKIEGLIESSNLLNHKNAACTVTGCNSAVNGQYGTGTTPAATFGQLITAASSRTVQFGARLTF